MIFEQNQASQPLCLALKPGLSLIEQLMCLIFICNNNKMRKRQLVIDTQFSELDSSQNPQNQQSSVNLPDTNESYDLKQQAIFNYMLLDLYYQGLQKVETIFEKRQVSQLQQCFNRLKLRDPHPSNYHPPHFNNIQFKTSPYKRRMLNSVVVREREQSDSVDKMHLLNNIADRIIETKRIKSESKHTSISNQDGKKIISKLDKLEKMIKSIRKENQMSHQGSVIYVDRYQRYPDFPSERMNTRGDEEWGTGTRRVHTPVRTPYNMPAYHQPFTAPVDRYYQEQPRYINQPIGDYHNRYIEPIPQYHPQPNRTLPNYNPNPYPSYVPQQRHFKEDQLLMSKRNRTPKGPRMTARSHRFEEDDNSDDQEDESDDREKNSINQQVRNIKQQLHELKKMNTEYIAKNTIMLDEARSKEKKYTYKDDLPQRNNEVRKSQYPSQKKEPLQRPLAPHPTISPIEFRSNREQFTQRQMRNIYQQQHSQSNQYPGYYPNREYINETHRHQEYRREVTHPSQQYITPVNTKHHSKQRVQSFNDAFRQAGRREDYQMEGGLYSNRYQ